MPRKGVTRTKASPSQPPDAAEGEGAKKEEEGGAESSTSEDDPEEDDEVDSHAPKEHRGKVEVVEPPKPPSPKPLSISEAQKLGVTYQEDDWLEKMYEAEAKAAATIQRHRRYILMKRVMPQVLFHAKIAIRQKAAVVRLQSVARGWLARTYKFRRFKKLRAILQIQHAERRRAHFATRRMLLRDGKGMSEASVQRALVARDAFMLLHKPERELLIPTLLALHSGSVEALVQAGDVWEGLSPLARARAIVAHLSNSSASEKTQIVRLCVKSCSAAEMLELLGFVSDGAQKHWGLTQHALVQAFLQAQPEKIAALAEDKLLDGIVETLPVDAVARSMQRLALFAHLPPIRSRLPANAPKQFERISQAPNPKARSARAGPPVAGGLFGPPPEADKPFMPAKETLAPPSNTVALMRAPVPPSGPRANLTPRAANNPRVLDRKLAGSRPAVQP